LLQRLLLKGWGITSLFDDVADNSHIGRPKPAPPISSPPHAAWFLFIGQ
jgi:hypothetical protein